MTARSFFCAVAALGLASATAAAATPSFTSIEIPLPASPTAYTSAVGLNDRGDVVGVMGQPCCGTGAGPFVYYRASGSDVALSGFDVGGINDSDKITGEVVDPTNGPEAVVWSKNGGVEILPSETLAMGTAIANSGNVAGNVDNGHQDNLAVMWSAHPTAQMTSLGVLWADPAVPDYATSTATSINNGSHIAGFSTAGTGTDPNTAQSFGIHAFLYRGGKMLDLGALALSGDGSDDSEGDGINNLDEVVGQSTTAIAAANSQGQACPDCGVASHAFVWRAGKMTDLGNLAGIAGWDSKADSINDAGEIVGWSDSLVSGTSTHRAFLYVDGQMLNLQYYVFDRDPNVRLTEAVGINSQGWIVANGFNVNAPSVTRIYLLIPRGPAL
jgi:probable HAF family extracellular repeat protein